MSPPTGVWAQPQVAGRRLAGDVRADVAIVGAGIVGLSLATMLGEAGMDVVVLSRHPVGEGVSGRSNAKVTALHQVVYADLERRHGLAAARTYAQANADAVGWLRERAGALWEARDAVTVARTPEEARTLSEEALAASRSGLEVAAEGPPAAWPDAVASLRLPEQGQVEPVRLLQRLCEGLGPSVALHDRTTVTSLRERPGGARLATSGGTVVARHVVVATGLPVFDRGGFFALCEPSASYLVALRVDDPPAEVGEDMMISVGSPTRSVRWAPGPGGGRVLLVGGESHRVGTGGAIGDRHDALERWARQTVPGLGERVAAWGAEDFMSPDRLPFAGPHLRVGGPTHVVTGLSKWGFTLGVACAHALAARLTGEELTDFGRLVDTGRLPDLAAARAIGGATAEVGRYMAGGWIKALGRAAEQTPVEGEGSVGRCGLRPCATSTVDGRTRSVSAVCTHLGGIVSWNDGDRTWDCPLHGSRFAPDGDVQHGPAIRGL